MPANRRLHAEARTVIAIACGRAVSRVLRLCTGKSTRRTAAVISVCVGLLVQVGLCIAAVYLIDLCISLSELWLDLARKHLEITL